MKKKLLLLFAALLTATVSFAAEYCMAGTSNPASSAWCCGLEWNAEDCKMTDGVYNTTVPAGIYIFKVTNGTWSRSWGYYYVNETASTRGYVKNDTDNIQFEVASQANISVSFDGSSITLTSDVPFVMDISSWTLYGLGCSDITSSEYDFVEGAGGIFTYKVSGAKLAAGTEYYASAYANHSYNISRIGMDAPITVEEDGLYDVELTLNPAAGTLVADVNKTGDWTPSYSYNIAGGGDVEGVAVPGWCCGLYWDGSGCPLTDGVYSATVEPGTTYWFKIVLMVDDVENSSNWIGYEYVDASASQPGYINGSPGYDGNIGFEVKQEGIVTVTCNRDKISLTCTVPFGDLKPTVWKTTLKYGELYSSFDMDLVNDYYEVSIERNLEALKNYEYTIVGRYEGHDAIAKQFDSNFNVGVSGQYKITFTAYPDANTYGVETEFIPGVDEYCMAGTSVPASSAWCCGYEWNPSDCKMTNGVYNTTVPAGTYTFKVTSGTWGQTWGYDDVDKAASTSGYVVDDVDNIMFQVASQANITVSFNGSLITLTSDVPFVSEITSWTLSGFGGDGVSSEFDFVEGADGKFTYTMSNVKLATGDCYYWASAYGNRNPSMAQIYLDSAIQVAENGLYDVNFTLDPAAETLIAEVTKTGDWTPSYSYNIAGGGDIPDVAVPGWCCGKYWDASGCPLTDGVYEATVAPGTTYWFKIVIKIDDVKGSSTWIGFDHLDASTSDPGYVAGGGSNIGFEVKQEGVVTVACNGDKISLTCTVPFGDLKPTIWMVYLKTGDNWPSCDMELVNNNYEGAIEYTLEALKDYEYWIIGRYEGHDAIAKQFDSDFNVGVSGRYKITFSVDPETDEYGVETELITSADEAVADAIYATNGTVFCSAPFEIFNLAGQNVTSQNGNLSGLYIVKTEGTAKIISVK